VRQSILDGIVDVDFFKEEQGAGHLEGQGRMLHLQVGDHMMELDIEPAKERQHKGVIVDMIPKLIEGTGHRPKVVSQIDDRRCPLFDRVELGKEEEST
jgi:hypothetical protein